MITFLDKQYAKNDREMIVTLFNGTRTANGFYRKTKNGIYLQDLQKVDRVFVRSDGLFVSCHKASNGRLRYMFATCTNDANWLGEGPFSCTDAYKQAIELFKGE